MIYVIDFSHCSSKEMMVLLALVRRISRGMLRGRCLRLPISPARTSIRTCDAHEGSADLIVLM